MRRYKFDLIIREGADEFWEQLLNSESFGVKEVMKEVEEALFNHGFNVDLKLKMLIVDNENEFMKG